MSDNSTIEWTDVTWNPVTGCTRVSEGCDHCYIVRTPPFRTAHRRFNGEGPGSTTELKLYSSRLQQPLRWRRTRRIFVNSLADLFHDDVPDQFIVNVFATMAATPQHVYQVLTKRPARMRSLLSDTGFAEQVLDQGRATMRALDSRPRVIDQQWPLPNVWLGVSVETQRWVNVRVPALLDTPAATRFLSCEPLLGPLSLELVPWTPPGAAGFPGLHNALTGEWWPAEGDPGREEEGHIPDLPRIDWVIAGGESGPGARPMHPDWPRWLRDQCAGAGVAFFFKQWGEWGPADWHPARLADETVEQFKTRAGAIGATHAHTHNQLRDGSYHIYEPDHRPWSGERTDLTRPYAGIRRWGKKHAGRELDGRTHDEFPAVSP